MMPVGDLVAARRAVQHCAELLGTGQAPFDLDAACAEFAAELALGLPDLLHPLLIGARPVVCAQAPDTVAASTLAGSWSGPSIHYAVTPARGVPPFVASFDNALALALTDRLFGGAGARVDAAPLSLPQSVVLSAERLVRAVGAALAALCSAPAPAAAGSTPDISANPVLRRLGLFKRNERAVRFDFVIEQDGQEAWTLHLAAPLAALVPLLEQRAACGARPAPADARDPLSGALAAIPLPLTAVLADLHLPLSRLAQLQPGDCIALSPRREVPLSIGHRVIACGTVGAFDERCALRLTRLT